MLVSAMLCSFEAIHEVCYRHKASLSLLRESRTSVVTQMARISEADWELSMAVAFACADDYTSMKATMTLYHGSSEKDSS
jgi:hypothetical protein